MLWGQPGQKICENPSQQKKAGVIPARSIRQDHSPDQAGLKARSYLRNNQSKKGAASMAQVVEHLLYQGQSPEFDLQYYKKKKKNEF
jgi:hypothetical protein